MNTCIIKSLCVLIWFSVLFPLPACALSGGSIDGKILEEGTNKPLANVIVVAQWSGDLWAVVESQTVCVHVESAITDAQGSFRLPGWHKDSKIGWVRNLEATISVHYPGYEPVRITPAPSSERLVRYGQFPLEHYLLGLFGVKPATLYMAPFTAGRRERLVYLQRLSSATGCYSAGEHEKNLLALRKALYEEALQLARPRADQKINEGHSIDGKIIMPSLSEKTDQEIIENLRYELEAIEFGYEAAQKRQLRRLGAEK